MKCRSWKISEEEAERKRQAKELIEKFLDYADKVAEEAVQRKREELGKAHDEEIKKLKQLTDVADAERKECRTALAVGNSWSCDAKAAGRFPDTEWWVIRARQKKVCGFVSSIVEIAFKMPGNTVLYDHEMPQPFQARVWFWHILTIVNEFPSLSPMFIRKDQILAYFHERPSDDRGTHSLQRPAQGWMGKVTGRARGDRWVPGTTGCHVHTYILIQLI